MVLPSGPLLVSVLQRRAVFEADAPAGTGLEWMTVTAVAVPAVLLVILVYLSTRAA